MAPSGIPEELQN